MYRVVPETFGHVSIIGHNGDYALTEELRSSSTMLDINMSKTTLRTLPKIGLLAVNLAKARESLPKPSKSTANSMGSEPVKQT